MAKKPQAQNLGDDSSRQAGVGKFHLGLSLLFSFIVALATVSYTFSTCRSVDQLKISNEITQGTLEQLKTANEIQQQALRPYVVIEGIAQRYDEATIGEDDETWLIQALSLLFIPSAQ